MKFFSRAKIQQFSKSCKDFAKNNYLFFAVRGKPLCSFPTFPTFTTFSSFTKYTALKL